MPPVRDARTGTRRTGLVNEMRGNGQMHFRTFASEASDGHTTAQAFSPLPHSGYSIMTGAALIQLLLGHAATIVLNSQLQVLLAIAQQNMNLPRAGMLQRVGNRLATNLRHVIAGQRVQRVLSPLDDHVNPDS